MRLVVDKYHVITKKPLEKPVKILLVSDFHISRSFLTGDFINITTTINSIRKMKDIDMFALVGDFVNSANSLTDTRVRSFLFNFIRDLADIAPVYMVRGNHDLYNNSLETEKIYQKLSGIENVILLDNIQAEKFGITITGFAPRHESYDLMKHGKRSHRITIGDFQRESFIFDKQKFNLILTHSPYSLTNRRAMRELPEVYKSCDLVLSGHLHNGLVPSSNSGILKRILNNSLVTDLGFWCDPKTGFASRHCRGAKFVGENKIGRTVLPNSRNYTELHSDKYPSRLIQITGKGICKFSTLFFLVGRPSVAEIIIESEK